MGTFVESIELYPERLENGKFLKHIHFRFPVYYNGTVIDDISWENESTVETVVLLSKIKKGLIRVEDIQSINCSLPVPLDYGK